MIQNVSYKISLFIGESYDLFFSVIKIPQHFLLQESYFNSLGKIPATDCWSAAVGNNMCIMYAPVENQWPYKPVDFLPHRNLLPTKSPFKFFLSEES